MANDDRKADKIAFEKRLNQLIRDFVKVYKSLANEFKQYKEYTSFELEIFRTQVFKKQQTIDNNLKMMEDYQLALRIPRQHFKHLEKLRFEEMIEQRDEIIKKMKKKGIDLTKKGSLIQMPDPSLPAAQQLEMLEGGKVQSQNTSTAAAEQQKTATLAPSQSSPTAGKKLWPAGMQRDFSTFSIVSKETADTKWENIGSKSSLVMAPQFKFGM